MKNHNRYRYFTIFIIVLINFLESGCGKQTEWLDKKSNKNTVVPETLVDFQAILDYTAPMTTGHSTAGLVGSDNFNLTNTGFNSSTEDIRNLYLWNPQSLDIISGDWAVYFKIIELSNIVLDGLKKIKTVNSDYNNIKGQAFFHRAFAYYSLVHLFCKVYSSSADSDLGLPIRLTSDVNIILQRSSLDETYRQIINDALQAGGLLSASQSYLQRPSSAAAYALLAKTYLNKGDYDNALTYADKCLILHPQLLDYNNNNVVNLTNPNRFTFLGKNNPEILFYAQGSSYPPVSANPGSQGIVAQDLYQSYGVQDLRKTFFYTNVALGIQYLGSYTGSIANFCGIATNEVYLIRAECFARKKNAESAIKDLNSLLINRYKVGNFSALVESDPDQALAIILNERRKELPFVSNLRWEDLRRLNKETKFQKSLVRVINNNSYTLTPNDKHYVFPIPLKEIQMSVIQPN